MELEKEFLESKTDGGRSRYLRIWGNHDAEWRNEQKPKSQACIRRYIDPKDIRKAARLSIRSQGEPVGTVFMTHGHQGSLLSDSPFTPVSNLVVRHGWTTVQRLFGLRLTSPAKDPTLCEQVDSELMNWASGMEKLLLVTGHTHRPIFLAMTHEERILSDLDRARKESDTQRTGELRAELEYVRAKPDYRKPRQRNRNKPCYFNTGCCSFSDGDVTAIELAEKEIRLVRWPDDSGQPRRRILLPPAPLLDVFGKL